MELCLDFRNNQIILEVINKGEGINQKDLLHIFTPFYRTKQTTEIQGYGIGLSIVKTILDLHQVSINVESIPNEKTIFRVIFKSI